jgi:hypothetical protein
MNEINDTKSQTTVHQMARKAILQRLESLNRAGITHMGRVPEGIAGAKPAVLTQSITQGPVYLPRRPVWTKTNSCRP